MFTVSKIAWMLLDPVTLGLLLALAGFGLLRLGRRRSGHTLIQLALGGWFLVAATPLPTAALNALESRFPSPEPLDPGSVDGVVLLGGFGRQTVSASRQQPNLNEAADRLLAFATLLRRHPGAEGVVSGGSGRLGGTPLPDSAIARRVLAALGIGDDRVRFDDRPNNTHTNALRTADLIDPQPGETWLLVTSAFHMPRAIAAFRAQGLDLVAYPVDYRTAADYRWSWRPAPAARLAAARVALREALGLLYYRLMGFTDDLLPAP